MGVQAESEVIYENCPFSRLPLEVLRAMSQQQQQQQYRDPPPYPGHSKQVFTNQPGFRQSFSGSETSTDVSLSSTENLATWQRQDPQGEETHQLDDGSYSILARLGMPPGAVESKGSLEQICSSSSSSSSPSPFPYTGVSSYFSYSTQSQSIYAASSFQSGKERLTNVYNSALSGHQSLTVPHHLQSRGLPPPQSGHYSRSLTPTYHHPHPYINQHNDGGMQEHSLHISPLPPPPQYPGLKAEDNCDLRRSYEVSEDKVEQTRSQPDLYSEQLMSRKLLQINKGGQLGAHTTSEPTFSVLRTGGSSNNSGSDDRARAEQMVELLTEENRGLQAELASCYKKVSKLQKFEMEIQKVHEAYESLVKSSQKRERLENALKAKLDEEVKKMRAQNDELRAQLQQSEAAKKPGQEVSDSKKDVDTGRMEKLQQAFSTLQTTTERREEMEKQLRSRLERELETYKAEEKGAVSGTCTPKEETKSSLALRQILNDKETKILQLETEIVRGEQRYLELQAARHLEENTGPQHAHLVALEKSSAETEKLIEEAKTEKLRHMEELYQLNRHVAELEAKVKQLQTQLTEKEAMIKLYQRATPAALPRSSSVHAICCSTHHSPRPSLIASTAYARPLTQSTSCATASGSYYNTRHIKTGSTSAIETGRKMSLDDTLTSREPFEMSKSDDDEEDEMRLWQV